MAENDNPVIHSEESSSARDFYKRRPAWLSTPVMVLAGVIILVGLIFAGRAIHHALKSKPAAQKTAGGSSQTANQSQTNQPASRGSSSGASDGTTGNSTATTPAGGGTGATKQLANTGPGDVVAIFAVSSLAGTGAHLIYSRYKKQA